MFLGTGGPSPDGERPLHATICAAVELHPVATSRLRVTARSIPVHFVSKHTYLISYDAAESADFNYQHVESAIHAYGTWAHVAGSTWLIVTDETPKQVCEYLLAFLPGESRVFVLKSGTASAWSNVMCRDAWLRKHL